MSGERYVLVGLGSARSPWFAEVARWATSGSLPAEFVKCISVEDLRTRLSSGRAFSTALVDARSGAVDRDLLDLAARHQVTVVVVADGDPDRWLALGAVAVLPTALTRHGLLDVLAGHSRLVGGASELVGDPDADLEPAAARPPAPLVAVTGAPGAGASTVAMALAQGLGSGPLAREQPVVLADLCLDAEQAMLHDARDIVPGVQELVEAHRSARPTPPEVRRLTFEVVDRGYDLLLGLRRHRDWAALRPRSFGAALDGLRASFGAVVADVDADLEGEAACGAVEVEERNLMARTATAQAQVVVVVGTPGIKGLHGLVRTVNGLRDHGVGSERVLAVVNRSARTARGRSELTRAVAELTGAADGAAVAGPVHLPERRGLDDLLRDGAPLPSTLASTMAGAVTALLEEADRLVRRTVREPVAVVPGELGLWAEQGAGT